MQHTVIKMRMTDTYVAPPGWINGRLASAKEVVDHYYDDEMCEFLDSSVKPGQIRSAILNELCSPRSAPRTVTWNVANKKAESR